MKIKAKTQLIRITRVGDSDWNEVEIMVKFLLFTIRVKLTVIAREVVGVGDVTVSTGGGYE